MSDPSNPRLISGLEYLGWATFKPGAWVRFKSVHEPGDYSAELEMSYKLLEITRERAVVRAKVAMRVLGKTVQSAGERAIYYAHPNGEASPAGREIGRGDEEIRIGKMAFNCEWVETRLNAVTTMRVWYTKEIPGGVAKSSTQTQGDYPLTLMVDGWSAG